MKRRAFVTGIGGQLGSYLAELLLAKGYEVSGLIRRTSTHSFERIKHIEDALQLISGDLTDSASLGRTLALVHPDEIYNLAAQSHVGTSFVEPLHTSDVTGLGALRLFEAARAHVPHARIYQSSTSELFGTTTHVPQTEETPFQPASPYGCAKAFAHFCAAMYRQAYGMHISCGINFNFESPRRSEEFVTRKITAAIGRIKTDKQHLLRLGNLAARRDWSHAKDVAQAAWLMLQQSTPGDYVIASGVSHSIQEFVDLAFNYASLNSSDYLVVDPQLVRPLDVPHLEGCANKARRVLGWKPTVPFPDLVREMVDYDIAMSLVGPKVQ